MGAKGVLVVSDLHVGSIFGMLPPDFKSSDDRIIPQSHAQQYLWERWQDLIRVVSGLNIVVVVMNGDMVDGTQDRQKGTELALPILADQAEAALECLRPVKRALGPDVVWYGIQGTEYHEGKAGREAEIVAMGIGARPYQGLGTGRFCREVLNLRIDGVIGNFSHGTSVATGFYRATPADREGIWSALAGKEGKMPKAEYVVRAHAHNYVHVEHASKHIVIGPCWQLQTRYMRKNSVYRMVPDLGAVIYWIDGSLAKYGADPVVVQKLLYPLPPVPVTDLEDVSEESLIDNDEALGPEEPPEDLK